MQHRMMFVVCVLYHLDEKWRGIGTSSSFERILKRTDGVSLHKAWLDIQKEGLLGKFSEEFCFDALYGVMNELEMALTRAAFNQLIRLDGSRFQYHIDLYQEETVMRFMEMEKFDPEWIKRVAKRINELLEEQSLAHKS